MIVLVFIGLGALVRMGTSWVTDSEKAVTAKNTILHLELDGVIMNGKKFLKNLKKYKENNKVKAISLYHESALLIRRGLWGFPNSLERNFDSY